ncbi:MAG: hypothetical protein HC906_18590 [Bacteroidales bacterium]|nr:hypothetical protein [Bacteroidales bacterium]
MKRTTRNYVIHDVEKEIEKLKNKLVNSILIGIAIVGLPALIFTIISSKTPDDFPIVSLISYSVVVIGLFFLKKINYRVKGWFVMILGFSIAISGLLSEGIMSDAFLYFIILSVLSSLILGINAGILILVASILFSLCVTYVMHKGIITYNFDKQNIFFPKVFGYLLFWLPHFL